jgi:hypothetical protein
MLNNSQNLEVAVGAMLRACLGASELKFVRMAADSIIRMYVSWDIDESLYLSLLRIKSNQDLIQFFHDFCEKFSDTVSVGKIIEYKKEIAALKTVLFDQDLEHKAQIADLMRYKHAFELGTALGKTEQTETTRDGTEAKEKQESMLDPRNAKMERVFNVPSELGHE